MIGEPLHDFFLKLDQLSLDLGIDVSLVRGNKLRSCATYFVSIVSKFGKLRDTEWGGL